MNKIYTQKSELGRIGKIIENKPQLEKERIKIRELSSCKIDKVFTKRGITITIIDGPKIRGELLEVSVRAQKNGKELLIDNPLLYQNPPIMVPDGTWHKETDIFGKETDIANFVENPIEALKEIIIQTVELTGK